MAGKSFTGYKNMRNNLYLWKPKNQIMVLFNRFILKYNTDYKGLYECQIC